MTAKRTDLTSSSTNTIKAELWDKMQFMFRNYYDRMVHAVLHYDNLIDETIMKNLLIAITELVPILHSRFIEHPINPFWRIEEYSVNDILLIENFNDKSQLEKAINSFITQSIPYDNNTQYKVAIFNYNNKSTLCMIVNHMCFDGGDFKYFLKNLAENYNRMVAGSKNVTIKQGSRSYRSVYSKLSGKDKETAEKLYKNISAVKDKHMFPFVEESEKDVSRILKRKIAAETFLKMKQIGKSLNVTINDIMLAVYIRALYDIGDYNPNESLTIPCMVDLRRHIKESEDVGLTNHTGFMLCSTESKGETINDTLINVINSVKKSKRDKFIGLYSLPLINLAYSILPYKLSEFAIKLGYANPLIGMSNIGFLDANSLRLDNASLEDGFMTGAIKYKPFIQLALTTLNNVITMTIAVRASDEDAITIEKFFDLIENNVKEFISMNEFRLNS